MLNVMSWSLLTIALGTAISMLFVWIEKKAKGKKDDKSKTQS